MNPVVAIVICFLMLLVAIGGLYTVSRLLRPDTGKHARAEADPAASAKPFADPADRTDPDDVRYMAALAADQPSPLPAARPPLPVSYSTTPATLTQVRDALLNKQEAARAADTEPYQHPGTTPTDPDATVVQLHAVGTWGGTAAQVADRLAAEHLAVTS